MIKQWTEFPHKERTFIIGEVALSHDGSLGMAHAFIDAVARAGADAVKFQTHIAHAESTPSEPWRTHFSRQDVSRYAYWERTAFTEDQWCALRRHAEERGLKFLSSPFSMEAVALLLRVGVFAWKVASGELSNWPMIDRMVETRLPMLLSTGMSSVREIDEAVARVKPHSVSLVVLQSTSAYPCPPEKIGLNMLPWFRARYACAVGLSDHSGVVYSGLAAATLGVEVLEVHVALSRDMFGPDVVASLTPAELQQLVEGIRFIEAIKQHSVDKDALALELTPLRQIFTKSVATSADLAAGMVLRKEHLVAKKPGMGIPAGQLEMVVGRRLRCNKAKDEPLYEEDLLPQP